VQQDFADKLVRAGRLQWALSAPLPPLQVEIATFGGDCEPTPGHAIMLEDGRLLFRPGKAAKLDIDLSADIESELWQKFIFLTAMAGSTAGLRSPIGPIAADPELRGFFRALMDEAFAVGKAKGVALDPAYLEERTAFVTTKIEPGMKASMAHDLERGNRIELDWLAGKVRAFGRELGIPTPASDTVYTALKLHRMGSR